MNHTIRRYLDVHPLLEFALVLMSAVSAHLMAVELYQLLHNVHEFRGDIMAAGAVLTLVSVFFLKRWQNHWVWIALAGFFLLQLLCQAIHHEVLWIGLPSAGLLLWLYLWAREHAPDEITVVRQWVLSGDPAESNILAIGERDFAKAQGLILFLSPHDDAARKLIADLPPGAELGDVSTFAALKPIRWYMPLLAIHTHVATPPVTGAFEVVLIPSADGKKGSGTWSYVGEFRELVQRLARPKSWNVQVEVLQEHLKGVAYEDMQALSEAVDLAKQFLRKKGVDPVLVDITSGQATCSAVGSNLTLKAGECFQYVSTVDYSVKLYDLRYFPRESPLKD